MNLFALAGLSLGVACFLLACFVLFLAQGKIARIWAAFNLSVSFWGVGTYLAGISKTVEVALFNWKLAYLPCTFIAIVFYHLVYAFCQLKRKEILVFTYVQGIIFLPLIFFTNQFITDTIYVYDSFYYHKATVLFNIWVFIFCSIACMSFYELFRFIISNKGIQKIQASYLFWGMALGWTGGLTTLLPPYHLLPVYPAWHFTICIYVPIMTYAIFRYRLMDISVVITSTGIGIAVYSVVLGIPFAIGIGLREELISLIGSNWWMVPLVTSTVLATTGPFLYLYFQRQAENQLMHEQRKYQLTLRQASSGMGKIKDLKQLLNLIVHIVTRSVHLEHCSVYLYNSFNRNFILGAYRRKKEGLRTIGFIEGDSTMVEHLVKYKAPLVYEEIKQKTQDLGDRELARVELSMKDLDAAVVVPSFVEDRLIAILMLGKKRSNKLFSESDLAVFTIVANQAALAIENAQFYEDMKKTQEQLFRAEKMATIGTMADGLSHQINNRLHALGFIAGDALDSIKLKKNIPVPPEITQLLADIEFALLRVQDNVKQGGEVVQGLLKYTRKGDQGMGEVDFAALIKSSFDMVQYKVKVNQLTVVQDFPPDLPKLKGNFTQLQEVFFNLIDNANDAMTQRRNEKSEPDYSPKLQITAEPEDGFLLINVIDNGIGVKKEDRDKLFTPFFTTKLSSKKGTGLGLYVIQKIIEDNHGGSVRFFSEYMKETRFVIRLPIVENFSSASK